MSRFLTIARGVFGIKHDVNVGGAWIYLGGYRFECSGSEKGIDT